MSTLYSRRSIRLQDYDYSTPAAYFVTIYTHSRRPLLLDQGNRPTVDASWNSLPLHFPTVQLDRVHFIVFLTDSSEAVSQGAPRRAPTLADVVRAFKGNAAREINRLRRTPGQPVCQRNYYEHIVRNERELENIREYIHNNPLGPHSHEEDNLALAWEQL